MSKCLSYYGASHKVSNELDYNGHPPKISQSTMEKIFKAIASEYPGISGMNLSDKKAVAKWVINEHVVKDTKSKLLHYLI